MQLGLLWRKLRGAHSVEADIHRYQGQASPVAPGADRRAGRASVREGTNPQPPLGRWDRHRLADQRQTAAGDRADPLRSATYGRLRDLTTPVDPAGHTESFLLSDRPAASDREQLRALLAASAPQTRRQLGTSRRHRSLSYQPQLDRYRLTRRHHQASRPTSLRTLSLQHRFRTRRTGPGATWHTEVRGQL